MSAATQPPGHRLFFALSVVFVGALVLSNLAAVKLIPVGPFVLTGGILLFPVMYIFGDVLTEVYGYARTRQVIWLGFGVLLFAAAFLAACVLLPPAPGWGGQEAFAAVFSQVPRIVAGSVLGYWVGSFANAFVMARLKVWSRGRRLWVRTIGSTVVGEGLDTVVFLVVAFGGVLPTDLLVQVAWSGYALKVAYEVVATPLTYAVIFWLKRVEGTDVYDTDTPWSPFRWSVGDPEPPAAPPVVPDPPTVPNDPVTRH